LFCCFISNGSCAQSEKVEILPDIKTNRALIKWKSDVEGKSNMKTIVNIDFFVFVFAEKVFLN